MSKSKKNHYLKNKDLYNEVKRCKEAGREQPSKELIDMFQLLVKNIMRKMYYDNPQDKDDCFQSAMVDLLKYWDRFDTQYKNAFGYYTQITKNGLAKGWNTIHPKHEIRNISIEAGSNSEDSEGIHSL